MKATKAQLDRAIANPAKVRLFLLHGADEAGSRAISRRIAAALGPDAERVELSGSELRGDPARLSDEAASISMFGTGRCVTVQPAGDETHDAVAALLSGTAGGNPVVMVAGALKANSKLLKLAIGDPGALAFESVVPNARDLGRLIVDMARERGLQLSPELGLRIAEGASGSRAIAEQELDKLAAYLDASPGQPVQVEPGALDAVGAALVEGDTWGLMDAVFGGDPARAEAELARLHAVGTEGIGLLRVAMKRALRANASNAVTRLLAAEDAVKRSGGVGPLAADAELIAIARGAGRRR